MNGAPVADILAEDFDATLATTQSLWQELDGARVYITGATGFIGTLLLEAVAHARACTGVDVRVVALAREKSALLARLPWTAHASWLEIASGDVCTVAAPVGGLDFVIHAANTTTPGAIAKSPAAVAAMVTEGTQRMYALAVAAGARRFLQISSGSVYGSHRAPCALLREDDPGRPIGDAPAAVLARAKREAEELLLGAAEGGGPAVVLARGFAMCGPWLPLDRDFAFGNFVGNAIRGEPVRVAGDGSALRSYLYASDVITWLWTLLLRGTAGESYNVGSEQVVSIGTLADRVATLLGTRVVHEGTLTTDARAPEVASTRAHWHVPNTARARGTLGLRETVPLDVAIVRTAAWWRARLGLAPHILEQHSLEPR